MSDFDFDMQAAWLRRFSADAVSNLGAFALRLKEAMPELVTVHEQKGLFSKSGKVIGVIIELGENRYKLEIINGCLAASISMVVRGITLNTKPLSPPEWFAKLAEETKKASAQAQGLSASLQQFMAG
ncbi:MAG: hypothetical protein KJS74_02840 [Rhodospirillales bacterium]|nr:hypothetical protein [Rhodospirillales bacterium]